MTPNPYCESVPTLLRAWDATSLRAYMECPRKYYYSIVRGLRGSGGSPDLEFGSLYHASLDTYDKALAGGASKEDALDKALEYALNNTVDILVDEAEHPGEAFVRFWSGEYREQWRCTGKIGRKKCPYSKKWHDGPIPQEQCGECGSSFQASMNWIPLPGYKNKNRRSLIRSIVEYSDDQPDTGGVRPLVFPDGRVASELSFRLELPFNCPDGTPYLLTGNMDGMVKWGPREVEETATRERKSTKNTLNDKYFARYAPNVQVDIYDLVTYILYGETLKPSGVLLEATQVAVNFTKICRRLINIPQERREETLNELQYWIGRAEFDAKRGVFPKNTSACGNAGGCPYAGICKLAPSARERFIPERFHEDKWNPLAER